MKKTQSCSPLLRIKAADKPFGFEYLQSIKGYFDADKFSECPVVDKIKHKDFDTTKGNIVTQVFMKEYTHKCLFCGSVKVIKREYALFYTKDTIINNFWNNVKPYTL